MSASEHAAAAANTEEFSLVYHCVKTFVQSSSSWILIYTATATTLGVKFNKSLY